MTRRLDVALTLMRMALALLDEEERDTLAACRLQHAIDAVGAEGKRERLEGPDPGSDDWSRR